jgi:hypothetical protein
MMTDDEINNQLVAYAAEGNRSAGDAVTMQGTTTGGEFYSGALQSLMGIGLGYVTRRADIELQSHTQTVGAPQRAGTGNAVRNTATTVGDVTGGTMSNAMGQFMEVLPLLAVIGGALYFLVKHGS